MDVEHILALISMAAQADISKVTLTDLFSWIQQVGVTGALLWLIKMLIGGELITKRAHEEALAEKDKRLAEKDERLAELWAILRPTILVATGSLDKLEEEKRGKAGGRTVR